MKTSRCLRGIPLCQGDASRDARLVWILATRFFRERARVAQPVAFDQRLDRGVVQPPSGWRRAPVGRPEDNLRLGECLLHAAGVQEHAHRDRAESEHLLLLALHVAARQRAQRQVRPSAHRVQPRKPDHDPADQRAQLGLLRARERRIECALGGGQLPEQQQQRALGE